MHKQFRKYIDKALEKQSRSGKVLSDENFNNLRQLKADLIRYSLEDVTKDVDELVKDDEFHEPLADPPIQKPLDHSTIIDIFNDHDSWFKDKDLIYNVHFIIHDSYVPPMFRDMWYEFYELQIELLTLYIYYNTSFDKSIAAFDALVDFAYIRLLNTLQDCRQNLRQKRFHLTRTSTSTKGHKMGKNQRKSRALQYYNQIKRDDLSLWAKAERIKRKWGKDAPTQRTIYNYLVEEGMTEVKKD